MTFAPLFASGPIVTLHALAAMAALTTGIVQLVLPKGGLRHRVLGWVWVALMTVVAVSSMWIHDISLFGPFSPIHILSVATLYWLIFGVRKIRQGKIKTHSIVMIWLFFGALIGAGTFTLLPGRVMHMVVFGQ